MASGNIFTARRYMTEAESYEKRGEYMEAREKYFLAAQEYITAKSDSGTNSAVRTECQVSYDYCMKMIDRMNDKLYGVKQEL